MVYLLQLYQSHSHFLGYINYNYPLGYLLEYLLRHFLEYPLGYLLGHFLKHPLGHPLVYLLRHLIKA